MSNVDIILGSQIGRKAAETSLAIRANHPCGSNILRQCLEEIDRLAQHQLSEFTDHGLGHIVSLVNRIDSWECTDGSLLVVKMDNEEAFLLLYSVLTHDIGMLSQNELDLEQGDRESFARLMADIPTWVRKTHVPRIQRLTHRLLERHFCEFVESRAFLLACSLAASHQSWPGEGEYSTIRRLASELGMDSGRICALAGILAVADLLDEDSTRCDSMTLFLNKAGSLLNRAHWLRHMLTAGPIRVRRGAVTVTLQVPRNLHGRIDNSLKALRNHLRLCHRYSQVLEPLQAGVKVQFSKRVLASQNVPNDPRLFLLLAEPDVHLLRTFMSEAIPGNTTSLPPGTELELVDRAVYDKVIGVLDTEQDCQDEKATYTAWRMSAHCPSKPLVLRYLRQRAFEMLMAGRLASVRSFIVDP